MCSRQMLKVLLLITEKALAIYNQYSAESKTVILGAPEVYVQVNNFLAFCLCEDFQANINCCGIKLILICLCSLSWRQVTDLNIKME